MRTMREMFVVLNQQRYSRDAVENLGKPNQERHERIMIEEQLRKEQAASRAQQMASQLKKGPPPQRPKR